MSGAIIFIQEDLHITEVQEEVLVGILSIISLLGSLAGGKTSDAIGRKWTMAFAAIVFQTGAAIMALAPSFAFAFLMLSRQLAGIGIGLGVMITPVYIGSVWGGSLTSFPGIFINLGIPLGYVSNYAFSSLPVHVNWRVAAGHRNAEKYEEKSVWRELLNPLPEVRRMLITGCGIQCFQQIMGIDATLYYSSTIFREAGIKSNSQLLAATVAVGFTKTIFILVAIFLIDRVGRKPLLYVSTIGMTTCLFGLGLTLSLLGNGPRGVKLAILSVCGNVAFFSVGLGPVCWVLSSEIFPLRLRAQASALDSVGSRVSSGLVAISFLSVSHAITVAGTFFVFEAISCLAVVFVPNVFRKRKGSL
ncbi:major facilitator superfamily protein [Actinidia rufa]|uniref:Major facilitator superfamily protein n=1 Tax=Actinidia rufa TaxID=165716 RepID=A0A7J0FWM0_9ERIC|nr:major facilitator superfamily protein [Actinidia rufa]